MARHKQIQESVAVIILPNTRAKMAKLVRHHPAGDAERAIAIAMVKDCGNSGQDADTARNGQIEIAIIVIIARGGANMVKIGVLHWGAAGVTCKRAVAVV